MSVTRPESDFYLIEQSENKAGIIIWNDGHSVGAEAINDALAAGMKHFIDIDEDGDHLIVCSKAKISEAEALDFLAIWDKSQED